MNTKRLIFLLAIVALAVAGVVGGIASSGANESQVTLQTVGAPAGDSLPDGFGRMFAEPDQGAAKEFAVNAASVRRVELQNDGGSAWLAPGADGQLCMTLGSAYTCTPKASRGLVLTSFTAPPKEYGLAIIKAGEAGLTGKDADDYVRKALADAPAWNGQAQYAGYVPAEVPSVSLLDADGGEITQITPQDLTFSYTTDITKTTPSRIRFNDSDIADVTLPDPAAMFGGPRG